MHSKSNAYRVKAWPKLHNQASEFFKGWLHDHKSEYPTTLVNKNVKKHGPEITAHCPAYATIGGTSDSGMQTDSYSTSHTAGHTRDRTDMVAVNVATNWEVFWEACATTMGNKAELGPAGHD